MTGSARGGRWSWAPAPRPELAEAARRRYWRVHVPAMALLGAVSFAPPLRAATGWWPIGIVAAAALFLAVRGACLHLPAASRSAAFAATATQLAGLGLAAAPAASTAQATSTLWAIYLLSVPLLAHGWSPSVTSLAAVAGVPLVAGAIWAGTGTVSLAQSAGPLGVVALAAAIYYAVLARRCQSTWECQQQRADAERESAAVAERQRIARRLHTSLGAALTEIALWEDIALASPLDDAREATRRARARTGDALRELRAAVSGMEGRELEFGELARQARARLEALCEPARVGLEVEARGSGAVSAETAYHLLKIVEESGLNAIRHGRPRGLRMRLWGGPPLSLRLEDDGTGFDTTTAIAGAGLRALAQHARDIGGTLAIDSRAGAGTRVSVELTKAGA